MSSPPTIAVLIACHNRRAKTLACLDALEVQKVEARLHVFLFDDGSTDGTAQAVRKRHPDVTILLGSGDAFWAGGMRSVFDRALTEDFDHYLWLNDDVVLEQDALVRLLAAERRVSASGHASILIGGAVADPQTRIFSYGGIRRRAPRWWPLRFVAVHPSSSEPRPCDTLHGNVVLIPRATACMTGSIGPAFIHTLGDLDYGLRVREAGGWVGLAPGFVGWCERNPRGSRWFDRETPVLERWRLLADPRGFPVRPWLAFARAHGGPLWPIHAAVPFWRLLVPASMLAAFSGSRRRHARAR